MQLMPPVRNGSRIHIGPSDVTTIVSSGGLSSLKPWVSSNAVARILNRLHLAGHYRRILVTVDPNLTRTEAPQTPRQGGFLGFLTSLPGILTALATLITAVG